MTSLKNWCWVIPIFLVSCSTKPAYTKPEAPKIPPRPWQRIALRGVTQTSLDAFGAKIVIRTWPSNTTPSTNSALLDAVTEIKRIDQMTNPGMDLSEVAKINREAFEQPVPISDELALILQDCNRMYQLSEGKFDVSYVPYQTEQNFTDDDINKIANWDQQPKLSPNPLKLLGPQGLLLDQNPPRIRRYNRRNRLNLNGMIRGYAIDKVSRLLEEKKLGGFAVISEGLIGAGGVALTDPGIMCIEDPQALGKCIKGLKAKDPAKILYVGSSPSLERRGQMFDPNSTWAYRSGGVIVAGPSAKWVQFAMTYGSITDEGRINKLLDKSNGLNLAGVYFDATDKTRLVGTLSPFAEITPPLTPPAPPRPRASPSPSPAN
jgi:thiamine biosynthesis lipoprotein ApbE